MKVKNVCAAKLGRDIEYVKYAVQFHKIARRSLKQPNQNLGLQSVVKFFYLHALGCRGDFGEKKSFNEELEDRANYQTDKAKFAEGHWSKAELGKFRDAKLERMVIRDGPLTVKTEKEHFLTSLWDSASGSAGAACLW